MKKEKNNQPVTIGHTESHLDRRERILEAKRRREELAKSQANLNQWAQYFTPNN